MNPTNRQWILKARPEGPNVEPMHFEKRQAPLPAHVRDGEFLVRNRWFSCDPSQRAWMDAHTYLPPVALSGRFNPLWFVVFLARFGLDLLLASFQVALQARRGAAGGGDS